MVQVQSIIIANGRLENENADLRQRLDDLLPNLQHIPAVVAENAALTRRLDDLVPELDRLRPLAAEVEAIQQAARIPNAFPIRHDEGLTNAHEVSRNQENIFPGNLMPGFPNVNDQQLQRLPETSNQEIETIWKIGCHIFGCDEPTDNEINAFNALNLVEGPDGGLRHVVDWWSRQQLQTNPPRFVVRNVEVTGHDLFKVFSCTCMPAPGFSHSLEDVLFVFRASGMGCPPTFQFFHAPCNMMFPSKMGTSHHFSPRLVQKANELVRHLAANGDNVNRWDLRGPFEGMTADIQRKLTRGMVRQNARRNPGERRELNGFFTIDCMWAITLNDNNNLLNCLGRTQPRAHPQAQGPLQPQP